MGGAVTVAVAVGVTAGVAAGVGEGVAVGLASVGVAVGVADAVGVAGVGVVVAVGTAVGVVVAVGTAVGGAVAVGVAGMDGAGAATRAFSPLPVQANATARAAASRSTSERRAPRTGVAIPSRCPFHVNAAAAAAVPAHPAAQPAARASPTMGTMTAAPPPDGIEVHQDVPLARHTYLRLGGPARYFAIPEDVAQLELLLGWARGEALSVRVLGGRS